jgi:murein DD-endopeptidase MepM/ murein hydrolase activator NlpD
LTIAGTRLGYALVLGLLASTGAAAQTPAIQNPSPTPAATQQTKNQPSAPAKISQETPEGIEPTAVVPPAPFVIRREESLISIPVNSPAASLPKMEGVVSLPKMERVVSLPKMEGIVSVPVALPKVALPVYEARSVVASSTQVKVGSVFGYRRDPFTRRAKFHSGVDLKAKWGDPVGASQQGVVQFAGWYHGYGNLVIVDHGGGVTTYYAHLSSFELGVGARVERGTIVGYAGSTGRATSPHLHYEVRIDGNAINPFQQVALDPSSAYFNQSRPATDVSGPTPASPAKAQRPID